MKNVCIFGNVGRLQIILRNEIPGNNNLFKVTDTLHIRNPDIFITRGIFGALEYSKVPRYLRPCQTNCNVFRK